ncbi:Thymidylate kinase [Syntrophobacter sp. SbD2]|nr:Thymidylate kinase [Syntrophobacter sp. SbD2]
MTKSRQDKPKHHRLSFPAKFISFEGIDGCGKSTLMDQLADWLTRAGIPFVRTREPGGTGIGEKIREILLDPASYEMSNRAEVLLYSASRAQLTDQVIVPAMKKGSWVLTDRFVDATFAYQGFGRGFDLERLRIIQEWTTKDLWPDRTILLDCDIDTAMSRLGARDGTDRDRIEQEDRIFHHKVRKGYLELAEKEPERFLVLDGSKPLEEVIKEFYERFWLAEVAR